MKDEIDLRDISHVIWESRFLIICIFMIAVLVAGAISFATPPTYKASCIITLGNFGDPIYTSQESATLIMLSDEYLLEVIGQLSFAVPPDKFWAFKESIKIEPVEDSSDLLVISIETPNGLESKEIIGTMVWLFAKRGEESYNIRKEVISDQLATTQERLAILDNDINQTRGVLRNIDTLQEIISVEGMELSHSRILDNLQNEEALQSSLLDRELELQKQLTLLKHLEVVQETKEPIAPIKSQKTLIVAVAGMSGLMVGIFAAFLREVLRRPVE